MGSKQIVLSGKELIRVLERIGFVVVRINGSHHRMKHSDGRVTTVPVHKNEDLPKGLLRKIIREDLQITFEELAELLKWFERQERIDLEVQVCDATMFNRIEKAE